MTFVAFICYYIKKFRSVTTYLHALNNLPHREANCNNFFFYFVPIISRIVKDNLNPTLRF